MSSNNTRCIFVNVLVNGNIYKEKVPVSFPNTLLGTEEEYIQNYVLISFGAKIPHELLSYQIVNEVTDNQQLVISMLENIFLRAGYHDEMKDRGLIIENGKSVKFIFRLASIGEVTIHAKDIVIKG